MTNPTGVEGRPDPFREWLSLYMRVMVTGSRQWYEDDVILDAMQEVGAAAPDWPKLLISGGAAGADTAADMWSRMIGWDSCVIYPDWKRYGRKAGFLRNRSMVRLQPHVVLAFIKNESPGATMAAKLAEDAGIPVWYYRLTSKRGRWTSNASTRAQSSKSADLPTLARSLARSA